MTQTIAQLAKAGGVGVDTVRYYQRRGLLAVPERPHGNGFRHYGEDDLHRLRFIRQAQAAGFTLEEIGELLALGLIRLRVRQSSPLSEEGGESLVDCLGTPSGDAGTEPETARR